MEVAKYQFVFAGLPENVEYYVAAGALASPHYTVRVVDLPAVKEIRATYHYPKWTGMKPVTEEHSGDLRAIEGTDAALEIEMDHPLKNGQLTLDDGQTIQLTGGDGNKYHGTVHMEKDGAYHVAAVDEGQPVRLSEDYFIATDKAQPPQISIDRPRGDYRANPIEEVTIGVKAAAQFGLQRCSSSLFGKWRPGARRSACSTSPAQRVPTARTRCLLKISSSCPATWSASTPARAMVMPKRVPICPSSRWNRSSASSRSHSRAAAGAALEARAETIRPKSPSARRN